MKSTHWLFLVLYPIYLITIISSLSQAHPMKGAYVHDATSSDNLTFVVSIGRTNRSNSNFCTGILITRWKVLTCEHCIIGENETDVEITIGSTDLRLGQKYGVIEWITYDQWYYGEYIVEGSLNDIAIITLDRKVDDPNVIPASIDYTGNHHLRHTKLRIAGWGLVDADKHPAILKFGVVRVIQPNECAERAKIATGKDHYEVPTNYFCSSEDPWLLTSCGDSGGPALNKKNKVVGITYGVCPKQLLKGYVKDVKNFHLMNLHLNLLRYKDFIETIGISRESI